MKQTLRKFFCVVLFSFPSIIFAHMPGFRIGPGGLILLVTYYYTLLPSAIAGFLTWLVLLISFVYHKKEKAGRRALKIGFFVFLGGIGLGILYSLGVMFFVR